MRNVRVFAAVLLALLVVPSIAKAQGVASVTGTVTDATGAAVPGASVKVEDTRTGAEFFGKTSGDGGYRIVDLPPGPGYSLTIKKDGFQTTIIAGLYLPVGTATTQDVRLEVGTLDQTIHVTAQGTASLNTTDATIGNVIYSNQVQDLPSLFRTSAASLLTLGPGVISADAAGSETDSQYGSVTGSRADQGNITLDGLDVNDETIGQAFAAVGSAPIDSIQEIHIVSGGPGAVFGRGSGGQTELVTKSGSNDWHGSLHEYNRVTALAANDFFNKLSDIKRPPLVRNQFGGNIGGPFLKDKFFFFFNYEGRRDALSQTIIGVVPNDTFRSGQLNYKNTSGQIVTTTTAQLQSLDPQGVGANQNFLDFMNSRYPEPNDFNFGDKLNFAGYRFIAPVYRKDNIFTGRLDYNLGSKHKLFGRIQMVRSNDDYTGVAVQQFPGDPRPLISIIDHDRSWVVGDTWTVSNNLINQAVVGVTRQFLSFPANYAPTAPNIYTFPPTSPLSNPFGEIRGQARNIAVPEIRDDVTYAHGNHTFAFGTDIKPIRVHSENQADINFVGIGLGGNILALGTSRQPTDLLRTGPDAAAAIAEWNNAFPILLGRFSQTTSFYAYDHDGNPLPSYTTTKRNFHYNEYEFYGQDTWRLLPDLTVTLGLRYQVHGVPFEENGFETIPTVNVNDVLGARLIAAANGFSGDDAAPLTSYVLGGKANHAPGYYKTDWNDLAPRVGIAYSPSFRDGFFGRVFGDRKTSIRAGAGIVYDRVLSTLSFELDQQTFVFDSNPVLNYPGATSTQALLLDPRFTALDEPPPAPAPPAVRPFPVTPNVEDGIPLGLKNGGFPSFLQFDRNLRTPYSETISFGIQRQLPGQIVFEADYFGRFGHKLLAIGDAAQTLNFKDAQSGQFLKDAFGQMQTQVNAGGAIDPQPWFENQISAVLGAPCEDFIPMSCTEYAATQLPYAPIGDLSSLLLVLDIQGLLPSNVGLYEQTGASGYVGNYSTSSYNSLLMSIRKQYSSGLSFDFDYTYSHSIDNQSNITNLLNQFTGTGQGLVCDLTNLRTCRADSLFDARHLFSVNYVYDLPVGRSKRFLHDSPGWVNQLLGGWSTSGIVTYRTGLPFTTHTGTFPIDFTQDAPAVFNGDRHATRKSIHLENGSTVQFFADQGEALGAFSFPFGGNTGTRNPLHGPGFAVFNMAVFKRFAMPWSDKHTLQFRWEAFNLFNHTNFAEPGSGTGNNNILLSPSTFGVITDTASSPRQMQFSLRYDF